MTYFQPFQRNTVEQVGEARAERRDFLAWLSKIPLRLASRGQLDVLGDQFTVSVPCAKLNL
ncbi:MAG: hypothetical protein OEU93_02230 [Rubrivivax sp.]|nr:hypothetical protein [Rubrivivax sp.]MDH5338617.1 hypothetical protein [Rubrivivax sp.]